MVRYLIGFVVPLQQFNLQFGFEARWSTDMCTMILKESVTYYVNNGSSVYSSAFILMVCWSACHALRLAVILVQFMLVPWHMLMTLFCLLQRHLPCVLKICDDYTNEYRVVFNAKKSACMYSSPCKCRSPEIGCRPTFYVGGQSVEYVNEWTHLGHIISANCDDKSDILSRRNTLCGQINNVLCYFGKVT